VGGKKVGVLLQPEVSLYEKKKKKKKREAISSRSSSRQRGGGRRKRISREEIDYSRGEERKKRGPF